MVKQANLKDVKKAVKNFDDLLFIFTGSRLKDVVTRGIDFFGAEAKAKAEKELADFFKSKSAADDPYTILGLHPEAMDIVVKAAYRRLAKEFHPDAGEHPDAQKFQRATEAYNAIMKAREKTRQG